MFREAVLILLQKNENFPTKKREEVVKVFLEAGLTEDDVLDLLKTLVCGKRELVPQSFQQLVDTSDGGQIRWILVLMADVLQCTLKRCHHELKNLSSELRQHLKKICDLFRQFKDAKAYGGDDGWEVLFGLVLLVRILTKQSDHLIDLTSFVPNLDFTQPASTSQSRYVRRIHAMAFKISTASWQPLPRK